MFEALGYSTTQKKKMQLNRQMNRTCGSLRGPVRREWRQSRLGTSECRGEEQAARTVRAGILP